MTVIYSIMGIIFVFGIIMEIRDYKNNDKCGCGGGPGAAMIHVMLCEKYCTCNACLRQRPTSGQVSLDTKPISGSLSLK